MKGTLSLIILIWLIIISVGIFVWETKVDIAEGLAFAVGASAIIIFLANSLKPMIDKLEYKEEYYIKW